LTAFGAREGISYSKLLYWRRKLNDGQAPPRKEAAPPAFAPLEIIGTSTPSESSTFDVWLANGVSVGVPVGFDEAELRRLVGVLSTC
jgi:hypothetical protein